MPKITLKFSDESAIPSELKQFKTDANTVEVWAGGDDTVAAETNAGLAANRDTIKAEKTALQQKYDSLLQSSGALSTEVLELRNKVASGQTVTAEEIALVQTVKAVLPTIKATDLKTMLEKYPTLDSELTTIRERERNRQIFQASGFKNEKVFLDLLGNKEKNPNLDGVSVKEVDVDGQKVTKAFVTVKGEGNKVSEKELSAYINENAEWKDYLPALANGGDQKETSWISQTPSDGGSSNSSDDPLQKFIADQNKKALAAPNPLFDKQPTSTAAIQN